MLNTPGHTPGHHALLVKLKDMGPVILSGDMAHFRENYDQDGVPSFNTDRSQTIASVERVKAAREEPQGDRDHPARRRAIVGKLPAFPAAAK